MTARALSIVPTRIRRGTGQVAAGVLAAAVLVAVLAPVLAPHDPAAQDFALLQPPSGAHPFGTDPLGRDVLSRTLYALRTDLSLIALVTVAPMIIGTVLGALAAFFGGIVDGVVRWLADVLQALPAYLLLIALVFALGPGTGSLVVAFAMLGWVVYARLIRTEVRRVREREFVAASYLAGMSRTSVLFRHVLPNSIGQTLVFMATDLGLALQAIAVLSFFGLGVPSGTPELGSMIADGQLFLRAQWWLATIPGLLIVALGVAIAAVGDRASRRFGVPR
jgi:peptide/nickel transport system permease protein